MEEFLTFKRTLECWKQLWNIVWTCMKKWGRNRKTWRSERRGTPDLKGQKDLVGALLGAPPQGLDLRVPFGVVLAGATPQPFSPKSRLFSFIFPTLNLPYLQWFQPPNTKDHKHPQHTLDSTQKHNQSMFHNPQELQQHNQQHQQHNQSFLKKLKRVWRVGERTNPTLWTHIPSRDHPRRYPRRSLTNSCLNLSFSSSSPFHSQTLTLTLLKWEKLI